MLFSKARRIARKATRNPCREDFLDEANTSRSGIYGIARCNAGRHGAGSPEEQVRRGRGEVKRFRRAG
jgi:hypothetical protein